jgi:HEAT repeat protein
MTKNTADDQAFEDFLAAYEPPPEDYESHQQLLRHMADSRQHANDTMEPILNDLREHGYQVDTLDDLDRPGVGDEAAVQLLLDYLPGSTDVSIVIDLNRALRAKWARGAAAPATAKMLSTLTDDTDPTGNVRFYLAETLERIGNDSIAEQMVDLATNASLSSGTRGLVVSGLARLTKSRDMTVPALLALLEDPAVEVQAAIALGKLKVAEARSGIERLTHDQDADVRHKARQALAKLPPTSG